MRHGKSLLGTLVVLVGLATSSASAQQFGVGGFGGNAIGGIGFNNFGGGGVGFGNNFGGGFNNFGGYGYGYNRGYNNYYSYPQTYNNLGGLMGTIRTQTGGGNSYRYGYGPAVGGRRR